MTGTSAVQRGFRLLQGLRAAGGTPNLQSLGRQAVLLEAGHLETIFARS